MRDAKQLPATLVRSLTVGALACGVVSSARPAWAAPLKIACVGEQTTHSDQLSRTVEYPAMLQAKLGAAYDAQNFGDCCSTVLMGYPKQPETHPYLMGGTAPSYSESLTFAPDVVVIGSWGKHDTEIATSVYAGVLDPATFQTDYEKLVTTYLGLPSKPRVFVSTPVPIPKGAPTGPTTTVILPTVKAMAAKYGLPIVDLYPVFLNQPSLYKDDTHVTDVTGLQTIADTVYAALVADLAVDAGTASDAAGATPDDAGVAGSTDASPGGPNDAGVHPIADAAAGANEAPSASGGSGGCAVTAAGGVGGRSGMGLALATLLSLSRRRRRGSARGRRRGGRACSGHPIA